MITETDILPPAEYARKRIEIRRQVKAKKRSRRVDVGPHITFYFGCYETIWLQVQEMIHIEKGGAEQIAGELEAYNPLVPNGSEPTATFMIEIDEPLRRKRVLDWLGEIEETAFIRVGGKTIRGEAEADQDRTSAEGKASSVQFVHFRFSAEQIAAFSSPNAEVVIGFCHLAYWHVTVIPEATRSELTGDFG
jgi:hypothetical protein